MGGLKIEEKVLTLSDLKAFVGLKLVASNFY